MKFRQKHFIENLGYLNQIFFDNNMKVTLIATKARFARFIVGSKKDDIEVELTPDYEKQVIDISIYRNYSSGIESQFASYTLPMERKYPTVAYVTIFTHIKRTLRNVGVEESFYTMEV